MDQLKKNLFRKQINTCHSFSKTHPPVRVVIPIGPILSPPVLVAPPVFVDETIGRGSSPLSSGLSLPISFQFCRSWHF